MDAPGDIIQLKVRLLGISPMIWRRVMVPTTMTLHELHGVLQVAMGWESIHLYAFDIYAVQYGSFELMMGSPRVPLAQFSFRKNDKFSYTYDMGDGWVHEIRIESVCAADPKKSYPLCTGGSGACPPEECGGPRGYLERRDEADGYGAWQDFGVMAEWLDDLTKRALPGGQVFAKTGQPSIPRRPAPRFDASAVRINRPKSFGSGQGMMACP